MSRRYVRQGRTKKSKNRVRGGKKIYSSWVASGGIVLCSVGIFFSLAFLFRSQQSEASEPAESLQHVLDTSPDVTRSSSAKLVPVSAEEASGVASGVIRQYWEQDRFFYRGSVVLHTFPASDALGIWLVRKQPFEYTFAGFITKNEEGVWAAKGEVRFIDMPFEQVVVTEVDTSDVERGGALKPGKVWAEGVFVFDDLLKEEEK